MTDPVAKATRTQVAQTYDKLAEVVPDKQRKHSGGACRSSEPGQSALLSLDGRLVCRLPASSSATSLFAAAPPRRQAPHHCGKTLPKNCARPRRPINVD
jgi:hypothetical protein